MLSPASPLEKRLGYPHTPLEHDKIPSDVLNGHLQCIDIQGYYCQEAKSHIFQNLFLNAVT